MISMTGDCIICGKPISIFNVTNACKECFDKHKRKDKDGNWIVEK